MQKFSFDPSQPQTTTFTGFAFYNIYKEAEFLRSSENIETILSKGYQLRQTLKDVAPGESVVVAGMNLERNTPLLVKKTGIDVKVEDYEFTNNRLTGLAAAYAFDNRHRFPVIVASEANSLGLTWNNQDEVKCRLYLAAVTGTEHFYDQFGFWPLICALRKLQLKKITPELVIKIAKIKNNSGDRLANEFMKNINLVKMLWVNFAGSSPNDLQVLMMTAPPLIKRLFVE